MVTKLPQLTLREETAKETLVDLRKRLLDLSNRSKLLNFRHTERSRAQLRLIDVSLNQIYEALNSQKKIDVKPIPLSGSSQEVIDRNISDCARRAGLNVELDLPIEGRDGRNCYAPLFADSLQQRLSALRDAARTSIQELGINTLFCAIGFLEWYEADYSDKALLSPLLLVPVEIERTLEKGQYKFKLFGIGEDTETNVTLAERLANDFGFRMPTLSQDDSIAEYIAALSDIISDKKRWRVRSFATVGIFNFSRLAMYKDLDPTIRTAMNALERHNTVADLLGGMEGEAETSAAWQPLKVKSKELSIVTDADSSQYRAISDAMEGGNLVVEGPPGTGKSQTISNLIASALAEGKRVLFIAEKLAALQVVKKRLDAVGIGDFCLELHSTKARKVDVLSSLNHRVQLALPKMPYDAANLVRLKESTRRIGEYTSALHSVIGNLNLSVFELIWKQQRHAAAVDSVIPWLRQFTIENAHTYDEIGLDKLCQTFSSLQGYLVEFTRLYGAYVNHPWYGLETTTLESSNVVPALQRYYESAMMLVGATDEIKNVLGYVGELSVAELEEVIRVSISLERPVGNVNLSQLADDRTFKQVAELSVALKSHSRNLSQLESFGLGFEIIYNNRQHIKEFGKLLDALEINGIRKTGLPDAAQRRRDRAFLFRFGGDVARRCGETFRLCNEQLTAATLKSLMRVAICMKSAGSQVLQGRTPALLDEQSQTVLEGALVAVERLAAEKDELSQCFSMDVAADAAVIRAHAGQLRDAGVLALLKPEYRASRRFYKRVVNPRRARAYRPPELLERLAIYKERVEAMQNDLPLREVCGESFQGIDTPFNELIKVSTFANNVRSCSETLGYAAWGIKQLCFELPEEDLRPLLVLADNPLFDDFMSLLNTLDGIPDFRKMQSAAQTEADALVAGYRFCDSIDFPEEALLESLSNCLTAAEGMSEANYTIEHTDSVIRALGSSDSTTNARIDYIDRTLSQITVLRSASISEQLRAAIGLTLRDNEDKLYAALSELAMALSKVHAGTEEAINVGMVASAFFGVEKLARLQPREIAERIHRAVSNHYALQDLLAYSQLKSTSAVVGCAGITEIHEQGQNTFCLDEAVQYIFYTALADSAYREYPVLQRTSGVSLSEFRATFQKMDRAIIRNTGMKLRSELCARPIESGNGVGPKSQWTDLRLIHNEMRKVTRHIPLRDLFMRAGRAVQQLKPCFMMSPLSVAQFIAPQSIEFDMVIIDEASQMRPEDAIGALSRSRQLVVVGDTKQLPPTSFFDRIDQTDEESDADAVDTPSILELALAQYSHPRRLMWHYRSRHESLIAFSNHHFYDNELIVFPSPKNTTPLEGVHLRFVGGKYQSNINVAEAQEIASAALLCMITNQGQSLGVVTMNQAQREMVLNEVERLISLNPIAAEYVAKWDSELEPFFVKNLESVQGDERDVILISTVYGPDAHGTVMQRFGPINLENGWRRLNVLFTRAKHRVVVFTSMRPADITVDERSRRGVRALRDYLEYAATRRLEAGTVSGRVPESDFEVAVADLLRSRGYEVVPQVGVEKYFIDLAVRHPRAWNTFILGIECDGASYHRNKSARDRDRLREEVLTRLGWRLYRIWSTDWFSNPRREVDKLVSFIEAMAGTALADDRQTEDFLVQHVEAVNSLSPNTSNAKESKGGAHVALLDNFSLISEERDTRVGLFPAGPVRHEMRRDVSKEEKSDPSRHFTPITQLTESKLMQIISELLHENVELERKHLMSQIAAGLNLPIDRHLRSMINKVLYTMVKNKSITTDWDNVWLSQPA